jgi:D-amino-acid N-acetyltransferase
MSSSSSPTIQIRPIQPADKETWANLWNQYNVFYKRTIPDEVTETTFNRFLDPNSAINCGVAVSSSSSSNSDGNGSGKVIGFANYYPHDSTASIKPNFYLHDLFVDPDARAGGVGEKLIEFVAEKAREADAYQLYWHTQYFNYRAQGLYAKVGERSDLVLWKKGL